MKSIDSQISPILMSDDASILAFSKRQVLLQKSVNYFDSPPRLPGRHEFPDTRFKTEGAEFSTGQLALEGVPEGFELSLSIWSLCDTATSSSLEM